MNISRKAKIKELETELRVLDNLIYVQRNNSGIHARHNKLLIRYFQIVNELEEISFRWKVRKFLRRFKK